MSWEALPVIQAAHRPWAQSKNTILSRTLGTGWRRCPRRARSLAVAALNGLLYAIGGNVGTSSSNAVAVYDPKTNTWAKKRPFPVSDSGLAAAVVNGTLYVIGGNVPYGGLWSYSPSTDTWISGPSMPYARYGLGVASAGASLYAVGGYDSAGAKYISDISEYTP